ncbi:hypothetical protein [Microbacterium sp. P05]|uniref:hypothetical protein n=1 Tax=Microbacterium sp. P05 TaxID=3366948 RepID=UPI003747259A
MLTSSTPAAFTVYQPIRTVEPPDSPLPGTLARGPDGRTVMLVDRDAVLSWSGWGAHEDAHVLSPLDVVRRSDGHDVVVSALSERLDRFLARRGDAGAPLSGGEVVTLTVSVIRGLAASVVRTAEETGEWWLAEDGKPLLVEGVGDQTARRASAEVLQTVAESAPRTRVAATLLELGEAMTERGFARDAIEWEERLFELAPPEALLTQVLGPLRARAVAAIPDDVDAVREPGPRRGWQKLAAHVDVDLADAASDAVTRVLRAVRGLRAGRVRPLLWAAGLALVVVVGGLLWPSADGETHDDTIVTAERSPVPTDAAAHAPPATPSATEAPAPPAETSTDLAAVTAQLLTRRTECTDAACQASVMEDPARELPPGVVDAAADARTVTLLDDFGGVVVLRVDAIDGSAAMQLVTIVETTQGWRIRDVHDVADAPS